MGKIYQSIKGDVDRVRNASGWAGGILGVVSMFTPFGELSLVKHLLNFQNDLSSIRQIGTGLSDVFKYHNVGVGLRTIGIGVAVGSMGVGSLKETEGEGISFRNALTRDGIKEHNYGSISSLQKNINTLQEEERMLNSKAYGIKSSMDFYTNFYKEGIQEQEAERIEIANRTANTIDEMPDPERPRGWYDRNFRRTAEEAKIQREAETEEYEKKLLDDERKFYESEENTKLYRQKQEEHSLTIESKQKEIAKYERKAQKSRDAIKKLEEKLAAQRKSYKIYTLAKSKMRAEWYVAYHEMTRGFEVFGRGDPWEIIDYAGTYGAGIFDSVKESFIDGSFIYPLMRASASGLTIYSNHINTINNN